MSYFDIDKLAFATNVNYFSTLSVTNITEPAISLLSFHDDFEKVLGPNAHGRKVHDLSWAAFHEAGVYNKKDNSLYIASNWDCLDNPINITVVSLDDGDYSLYSTHFPDLLLSNGGTSYYPPGADTTKTPPQQVYADQGDFTHPSQLVAVDPNKNTSKVLLTNFRGRNFSTINDVRQHADTGDLWFTDADYGWFQGFRPEPEIPKQVYRFEPKTGIIQAVADGFIEPNGLEFSPDFKTLYVSDTGREAFDTNKTRPATVYAFDVDSKKRLSNRRIFAWSDSGIPDGLHTDTEGNLFASAGDGVQVWNPEGILLGKIFIGETSSNMAFAPGKLFIFSNNRFWVVDNLKAEGREVRKDYGPFVLSKPSLRQNNRRIA